MNAPVEMTQAEYARYRGVSPQAINKQVKAQKIPLRPNGKIDVAAADRALGETRERVTLRDDVDEPPRAAQVMAAPEAPGLTKAKTATEIYKAKLARLDYEKKTGELISAAAATREWARVLSKVVSDTETFLFTTLARETAELFGLDWKKVSVAFREAYRRHRADVAQEAQAELAQLAELAPSEAPLDDE
jgi:hypothetical protein